MRKYLKDYFIPHEGNDYKPHSLQKAAMFGMVFMVLLSFTLVNFQSLIWVNSEWLVSTVLPSVIVDLTNDERSDSNLSSLRRNTVLDHAAQLKAQHMVANEYFAHYSPDGISPWYWFSQAAYNYIHAGENLAIHFTDSDELVQAWMKSPAHRANIENGNYTEIGVGAVEGTFDGYKTVYVVQLFGTPSAIASEVIAVEPEEAPVPVVLAESETVIFPDEFIPQVAGSEETVTEINNTEVALSSDRDFISVSPTSTREDLIDATEIEEVDVTEESVVLYSDLISTSTGGIPATIDPNQSGATFDGTNPILAVTTQPQTILQIVYTLITLLVAGSLILSVFIEIRKQHPIQIAYSAGLVAVMMTLFYIHVSVTSGVLIV